MKRIKDTIILKIMIWLVKGLSEDGRNLLANAFVSKLK
jgi:hypothetical protein